MIEIRQTDQYARWFKKLKDPRAKAKMIFESEGYHLVTLEMPSQLEGVYQNCELITVRDTESIL